MNLAPIILFVYNRPWHTEQTLNALMENDLASESVLYLYCDGPEKEASEKVRKSVEEVRKTIRQKRWCKEVIIVEQEGNLGLAASIIQGVTEVIERHGKIIVLEDDIKVNREFLRYMNEALKFFEAKPEVFHISGFSHGSDLQFMLNDFFFLKFMSCWGWGTWRDRWTKFNYNYNYFYQRLISNPKILADFNYGNSIYFHHQLKQNIEGSIKTWAILWYCTIYFNNGLCLTPKYSFVENIGMDGSGVHCGNNSSFTKKFPTVNSRNFDFKNIKMKEKALSRLHLTKFYKNGLKFRFINLIKRDF